MVRKRVALGGCRQKIVVYACCKLETFPGTGTCLGLQLHISLNLSTFGWLHQSEPSFSFLGLRCHTIIPCLSMRFGTGVVKCKGRA